MWTGVQSVLSDAGSKKARPLKVSVYLQPPVAPRLPWSGVVGRLSVVSVTVVPLLTCGAVDLIGPPRPSPKCQVQSYVVAAAVVVGILLLIVKLAAECT